MSESGCWECWSEGARDILAEAWEDKPEPPRNLDPKAAAGSLKPQLQLVPPCFEEAVAGALQQGAERYGAWNWRENQVAIMTYIGAIRRHLNAFLDGEDDAPDSGISHLGHIGASCAILLDAKKQGTLVDDRPKVLKSQEAWANIPDGSDMRRDEGGNWVQPKTI